MGSDDIVLDTAVRISGDPVILVHLLLWSVPAGRILKDCRRMHPPRHLERIAHSRKEILQAIGDPSDLVFVRGLGNLGDELSWAGARELLSGLDYREIGVEELPEARGQTALICGSGGFCRSYHGLMPHVLAVAEMRFERVVLLPSSFDTSADAVRDALEGTRAVIFARERESYSQIQSLCDARLAHGCAFFFDYTPYRKTGSGVLLALRTDHESARERPMPPESDDISATAGTLERWLQRIAGHELIRTDRAQVMIAAALLGKTVEFDASSYFKVPAIADYALRDFPVRRLPPARTPGRAPACLAPAPSPEAEAVRERHRARAEHSPPPAIEHVRDSTGSPRVTAVIVSHNRPELVLGSLHSLIHTTSIPVNIVVIENNSTPRTRRVLEEACAEHPQIQVQLSERDLGAAGGRKLALELVDTELVLFLDDDAELLPGALEHMVSELDLHPDAEGVTPLVVLPDGRVSHSGQWYEESPEIVSFTSVSAGVQFDDPDIPVSGPCDWVPWTASLIRRSLFEEFPPDERMFAYFDDCEWCLRVARSRSRCFRRSREAVVLHHAKHKEGWRRDFIGRANLAPFISAEAHFYRVHGLLLRAPGVDVFAMMPELTRTDGTLDLAGARLIMELASTHSDDWLLMEWMNGGLDPVLGVERTALGDALHASHIQNDALRAELATLRSELEGQHLMYNLHHEGS